MKPTNSILKANRFLNALSGRSPADLSEESQRELVKIYHSSIKVRENPYCPVELTPRKNVYRTVMRLNECALNLVQKDPRQLLYTNLLRLDDLLEKNEFSSELEDKLMRREERICIQFEGCNIHDEELEAYYKGIQKLKEKRRKEFLTKPIFQYP